MPIDWRSVGMSRRTKMAASKTVKNACNCWVTDASPAGKVPAL